MTADTQGNVPSQAVFELASAICDLVQTTTHRLYSPDHEHFVKRIAEAIHKVQTEAVHAAIR